jgi:hypothetical protein
MIQRPRNNPRNSSSLSPKKFKIQKSSSKVSAFVFWNKDGILLVDCLQKVATIMASFLKESCFLKTMLLLTHQNLADLHSEVLKHPAYSPDLASSAPLS